MSIIIDALGQWKDACLRIRYKDQQELMNAIEATEAMIELLQALNEKLKLRIRKV